MPFRDTKGNWWFQVKPGLCRAGDCFAGIPPDRDGIIKRLRWQHKNETLLRRC